MKDCSFANNGTAIHIEGGYLEAENTTFEGNGRDVVAKNAIVRMRNTKSS